METKTIYAETLHMLFKALDRGISAIEGDDKMAALFEISSVRNGLRALCLANVNVETSPANVGEGA